MRILWVKVGGLWPLNTGGRIRSFHILSELTRRYRVTLATTHGPGDDSKGLMESLPRCERVLSVPYAAPKHGSFRFLGALGRSWFSPLPVDLWRWRVPGLRDEVSRLASSGDIDLCVADFLCAMPNIPLNGAVPVVLFEHNVEYTIWKRLSEVEQRPWRRILLELEWRKMRRYEARACGRAALTIAVSERDRTLLNRMSRVPVRAIPTGVDTSYFDPNGRREEPFSLVFTGSMEWYPNEDAILYFVDKILPRIRAEIPEAHLTVVGRNPTSRLFSRVAHSRVLVTGTVDDVRPYVAAAAVYVVPLRIGGGTRLKIFEALAMGKAVVSTTVGAEGLPLIPGEHVLLADDPHAFARAVVRLLQDPQQRTALGKAGRTLVEEHYSSRDAARRFEEHCEETVKRFTSQRRLAVHAS